MAIEKAIQRNSNNVDVYGEKNKYLFCRVGQLQGYTQTTVTIKEGSNCITYNEKGAVVSQRSI